jgi:CSLREA domain-containing protein
MKLRSRARKALRSVWLSSIAVAVALLVPATACAATIAVTTTADQFNSDPAACSLREAIWSANHDLALQAPGCAAGSGADVITVPAGTYNLSIAGANEQGDARGDLDVTAPVAIERLGADPAIVDAKGIDRVFELNVPGGGAATISGLAIEDGHSVGPPDFTSTGAGGGILVSAGSLVLQNSTVSNNLADSFGGGVEIRPGASATLTNDTISGNRAQHDGGGLDNTGGAATLLNVTVAGNYADAEALPMPPGGISPGGGGIGNFGTTSMHDSVVAGNAERRGQTPDCYSFGSSTLASQGNTLIGSTTGCPYTSGSGDITGVDAKLGPLAYNGGPTPTHALLPDSPAIDRGAGCAQTDQRGVPRSAGGACDLGAYELVRCHGRIVTLVGTNGPDWLTGTPGPDAFLLMGGNDRAFGLGGNDLFCGGAGKDFESGGPGNDRLYGDTGRDRLLGGPGNDLLVGGGNRDSCNGGAGRHDRAPGCEVEKKVP